MPSFTKLFRSKENTKKVPAPVAKSNEAPKPQWVDSWLRTRVDPDEVVELLHGCTHEMKSRALDVPFVLLPFRPSSDPSAARTFVRNYFIPPEGRPKLKGNALIAELQMTEVMVLASVMKWCWARLPGGVISWDTYKMFSTGEKDSNFARNAYSTFLPLSVDTKSRVQIINDYFDLLASLAAHAKSNGLGGYKLSRYAGWWTFEHFDVGKGFDAGYKSWSSAADAASHMFFAYLRSLAPEPGKTNGILDLPISLQQLVASVSYPPSSGLIFNDTTKVVMIVDTVSPTPDALLRRAKNFEYRDDDKALREFAEREDPVQTLTDECGRVLRAISITNQSHVSNSKTSTSLKDPSWSRFEDIGFSSALDEIDEDQSTGMFPHSPILSQSISPKPSNNELDLNRPTTPSWADFLSSGFAEQNGKSTPILLPPDKILPPIMPQARGQSSQSHHKDIDSGSSLEPGELASITKIPIDDAFWWVWISSLAGEEPTSRKAVFGRCAYVETTLTEGRWLIMEEQVKGAAPEPVQGAYIAEKKGFLSFASKKGRLARRQSQIKKSSLTPGSYSRSEIDNSSRVTLAAAQQAKIRKAAIELSNQKKKEEVLKERALNRKDENSSYKTSSAYTLGPLMKDEASPALQWAKQYDKNAVRAQYLGNELAGKGSHDNLSGFGPSKSTSTLADTKERDLPDVPQEVQSQPQVQQEVAALPPATIHDAVTVAEVPTVPTKNMEATSEQHIAELEATPAKPISPVPRVVETLSQSHSEQLATVADSTQSRDSSLEAIRKSPSMTARQNGIKRLFGTIRKQKEEPNGVPAASPTDVSPSVAAARRALEGKASPNTVTDSPPRSNQYGRYQSQSVKDRIAALSQQNAEQKNIQTMPLTEKKLPVPTPVEIADPAPVAVPPVQSTVPTEKASEPVELPEQSTEPPQTIEQADHIEAAANHEAVPAPEPERVVPPQPQPVLGEHVPPHTRRDEEFDQLSRVDTQEREQADQEFSRFDQGSVADHRSSIALESPTKAHFHDDREGDSESRHKHPSVYSAVTMQTEATDDESHTDGSKQVSASDRWAQIRRNAAERAARTSEDHGNRSRTEARTDDGETSGEETIESRVARIKARVAELTGNMEQVR